ncbi:MAG: zinc ribbon domain-containing protein, partial [Opitutae bacterium]
MGFARLFKRHVFWRNQRQILHKLKLIMPTYDYQCQSCGHEWELFQSMNDSPVKSCPKCKKRKAKRLMGLGAGLIFKGTGFYETDYKRAGSPKKESGGESSSSDSSSGSKGSQKKTSSTDSKSPKNSSSKKEKA